MEKDNSKILSILSGEYGDTNFVHDFLKSELLPQASAFMNENTLKREFALFPDDPIPSNQRNLTDVRTRMGVLLEYELAKAINYILSDEIKEHLVLTYVISNRFPDLAFRNVPNGNIGIRFEIKAIQTIAEEKSANFDTLIKDIRKDRDYIVVLLWEWVSNSSNAFSFPNVKDFFVLNAYDLAHMRDCYWLNCPPKNLGGGHQGFDLCYGVNCREGQYNKEEGNYGKLMRIFNNNYTEYLPDSIQKSLTLQDYFKFSDTTVLLGIKQISSNIADMFGTLYGAAITILSDELPFQLLVAGKERNFIIAGSREMPKKKEVVDVMKQYNAEYAMLLNAKFDWRIRDLNWIEVARGNKPAGAEDWIEGKTITV